MGVGCAQNVRLRSANRGNANNTWYVNASGNVNNNNATWSNRFAPDCADKQAESRATGAVPVNDRRKEPKPMPEKANNSDVMQDTPEGVGSYKRGAH